MCKRKAVHRCTFRSNSGPTPCALLQEILGNASLVERIADTTAIAEVKALEDFFQMLTEDSAKAFYGPGHVITAAEQGAVAKLLIADSLYLSLIHI